jgi:endonuclease/exonuclease/phosphatase family metal-dependent hydrolase
VQENLSAIHQFLKQNHSKQFIFIQEIDVRSKRSYRIDQTKILTENSGYTAAFAPNYKVTFVPIPPRAPMGQVHSGIMTQSRFAPESATRYGYPGAFKWPSRIFNLRRCMLVNSYPTSNGKQLIMINTHKSAFDDGSLKKQEMQFMKDFVMAEYAKGNYVVVGGDWNQSPPDFPLTKFGENYQSEFFILSNIAADYLPAGWQWVFDPEQPTNRYLNEAYQPGRTFRCLIDFFLVSPNVEVLEVKTHNLNFRNSDHNPVSMRFGLK